MIATRNRALQFHETLRFYDRIVSDVPWEILVIDNHSSDDTTA